MRGGLTKFMVEIRNRQRQIINMLENLGERIDRIGNREVGEEEVWRNNGEHAAPANKGNEKKSYIGYVDPMVE